MSTEYLYLSIAVAIFILLGLFYFSPFELTVHDEDDDE